MEKINLKIGDLMYSHRTRYRITEGVSLSKISRITKTLIILENGARLRFNDRSDGSYREITGSTWYTNSYKIATDEDIAEFKKIKFEIKINNWYENNKDKFSFEQKKTIYNIINNESN